MAALVDTKSILAKIPHAPGVYIMRDQNEKVVYVGKASDLKNRVSSYFNKSGDERPWTALLPGILGGIDTIVTSSEKEAFILENELIKRHKPRYNVQLKDDKRFLLIEIDKSRKFPRPVLVRKKTRKQARYFGPFHAASKARQTFKLITNHFGLRTCSDREFASRKRACLQGQMGRCSSPCIGSITKEEYDVRVNEACMFLSGKAKELLARLEQRMEAHAEKLEFEQAAIVRDQIAAVRASLERQNVAGPDTLDRDAMGVFRLGHGMTVYQLCIRNGVIVSGRPFHFTGQRFPTEELLSSLVYQVYKSGSEPPKEVLLPMDLEDSEVMSEVLSAMAGHKVSVKAPKRGRLKKLIDLAEENARWAFQAEQGERAALDRELEDLKQTLGLEGEGPLHRIEAFDVSHLGGENTSAAMSVLTGGKPDKAQYRRFNLKVSGGDDYAALREALSRRFAPGSLDKHGSLPDILLIDGGRRQLGIALDVLSELGLEGRFCVAAIAKARSRPRSGSKYADRVFLPGVKDPLPVSAKRRGLRLLQLARDEAHRFGILHTRKVHRDGLKRSALQDLHGVGRTRASALLRRFGSIQGVRSASVEEIAKVCGIGEGLAKRIKEQLKDLQIPRDHAAS